jgi:DNA-binding NarL/FixJ family response regulator
VLHITPHERHALQLIARGHEPRDIGTCLGIPESEVERRLTVLFARMGAATRAEAIADASRRGLLTLEGPGHPDVTDTAAC